MKNEKKNERFMYWFILIGFICIFMICAYCAPRPVENKTRPIYQIESGHYVSEFGYNGHDYVEFHKHGHYSIVHSPDCHCYQKNDSIEK